MIVSLLLCDSEQRTAQSACWADIMPFPVLERRNHEPNDATNELDNGRPCDSSLQILRQCKSTSMVDECLRSLLSATLSDVSADSLFFLVSRDVI